MKQFKGRTAVITGAASGFGLEAARIAAREGMNVVMADVQDDALQRAAAEIGAAGAALLPYRLDVSKATEVEALGAAVVARFGAPHFVFNNAGVGSGGLIWESTLADWEWVLGVNLMGVVHGIQHFVPRMLEANRHGTPGHIVNTASMAGWLCAPLMGVYNVSKHAVVALSETLHHDLRLAQSTIGVTTLCPAFVPTGIADSHRNRPEALANPTPPTTSQRMAQAATEKAVSSGRMTAEKVAQMTFDAVRTDRFYVFTHPQILPSVQARFEAALQGDAPADPFAAKPSAKPPSPAG